MKNRFALMLEGFVRASGAFPVRYSGRVAGRGMVAPSRAIAVGNPPRGHAGE